MKHKITKDTIVLTSVSVALQGMSLILNVCITKALGESAVGILSLVTQFFVFALILSNGNIFSVSGRFISEEIGKGCGNAEKIMSYCLIFGIGLSTAFAIVGFVFSGKLSEQFLESSNAVAAIRIMALSLPLATTGSCIKGYFHAERSIIIPCIADFTEFIVKGTSLALIILIFVKRGVLDVFTAVALSIMLGEAASCIMLSIVYARRKLPKSCDSATIPSFPQFVQAIFPIVASAYIFVFLSGANEALVPLTLKQFSGSAETALSEYGIFEGIILPVIFFPSVILQSLSCILVPEIARESKAGNDDKVREITKKAISDGFAVAFISAGFLFTFGKELGTLLSDNSLVSEALLILCPVIPFIYLEMILEGVLKGLGKQNFCTVNSTAEYVIRISCVLVFVRVAGFYGIIISYFASNIICNIIRIVAVHKTIKLKFSIIDNIIIPAFSAGTSVQLSLLLREALSSEGMIALVVSGIFCAVVFIVINKMLLRVAV